MSEILEKFKISQMKQNLPELRPGDTVKVFIKIIGEKGEAKTQIFEGLIIARKHGKGLSSTITVRKIVSGIGVEKIFPVHSPVVEKIEIIKRGRVRRAKLYYIREAKGRKARLKRKEFSPELMVEEKENPQIEDRIEVETKIESKVVEKGKTRESEKEEVENDKKTPIQEDNETTEKN